MKWISALNEKLQKNQIVLLVMFLIALIGGVITIITGWSDFTKFLSIKFEVSIGAVLVLALIIFIVYYITSSIKKTKIEKELITVEGKNFGVQQVELDGKKFVNCEFDGTELVFKGKHSFALEKNSFNSPLRMAFTEHAGLTLQALKNFNNAPEFREYIQNLFK